MPNAFKWFEIVYTTESGRQQSVTVTEQYVAEVRLDLRKHGCTISGDPIAVVV